MNFDELCKELEVIGPQIFEEDTRAVECELGHALPEDFRTWLLGCNGGMLDARFEAGGFYPDILFGIRDDDERFSMRASMLGHGDVLEAGGVPIGNDHSGTLLILQLRGPDVGMVRISGPAGHRYIAQSFSAFVGALAIAKHESESDTWYMDGREHLSHKRIKEALGAFHRAWAISAEAKHAHWIAESLSLLGQREESYMWYERAYTLDSRNSKCATTYAQMLIEQGRGEDATRVLRRVLESAPTYGPARKMLEGS